MTDITPRFPIISSSEIPGGILNSSTDGTQVILSGTMVQPKKDVSVGGMQAGATTLTQGSGDNVYIVSSLGIHLGAANFVDAPFSVNMQGALHATSGTFSGDITGASGTFSGTITATTGAIGGFDIGFDYIRDVANTMGLSSTVSIGDDVRGWAGATFANRATAPLRWTESGALTATTATITGAITAAAGSVIATQYLSGAVGLGNTNIAAQGWTNTCVFSATDYRVVAWATGVFTTAAGTIYNITGANTGNMTTTTYIYLDVAVSTTLLQITTTASTAIGSNKVLIAVASPNTDTTSKAQYQVFGGIGGQRIFVDNISANSASTNEFVSNSAQIANLVVTNAKINDLDVGKLTAGTITSKAITLAVSAGTGDSKIQAGKTDFTNTDAGFILGIDDSDSDKAKFYIGSSTQYLNWTGTALNLEGVTLTASTFQSSATGERIVFNDSGFSIYNVDNTQTSFLNSNGCLKQTNFFGQDVTHDIEDHLTNETSTSGTLDISKKRWINDGGEYSDFGAVIHLATQKPSMTGNLTKTGTGTITMLIPDMATGLGNTDDWDFVGYNKGTAHKDYKIQIDGTGTPNTFKWSDDGGVGWVATTVSITGEDQALTSADGSKIYIKFSATTGGVSDDYWTGISGAYTDYLLHFKKMIRMASADEGGGGVVLWVSDGTSPNGALSGNVGDICFYGDSGKMYHCTGTTNWTSLW